MLVVLILAADSPHHIQLDPSISRSLERYTCVCVCVGGGG